MAQAAKDAKSKISGQFSMFSDIMAEEESIKITYPNLKEYDTMEKLKKEKEICGIYISGSPLDDYMSEIMSYNFNSSMIQEGDSESDDGEMEGSQDFVSDLKDGMDVDCGGVISEVKRIMTKQGNKPMAIITIEDVYGEFDCMMFNKVYEKEGAELDVDRIAHIKGRLSIRVGDKPIILIEKIDYLDKKANNSNLQDSSNGQSQVFGDAKEKEEKVPNVYMKFDITDNELVSTISEIVSCYQGKCPVFVQHEKKLYPLGVKANPSNSFVAEISEIIGSDSIKII